MEKEYAYILTDLKTPTIRIESLCVADVSVLSDLISGHTMAPTVLIGGRVSEFIKRGE